MVERERRDLDRAELESALKIDDANLNACLVEQSGYFYHVAASTASANAHRDTLKLVLEEALADLDQDIRAKAIAEDKKLTESGIQNQLRQFPKIKELQRRCLEARLNAEKWQALKEAFSQRSFMLRELVALELAQVHSLNTERGVTSARQALGSAARQGEEALRKERRALR